MKFCPDCSAELAQDTNICPNCGKDCTEPEVTPAYEVTPEKPKAQGVSIPLVLGILGIILSAFTLIGAFIGAVLGIFGIIPIIIASVGSFAGFVVSIVGIVLGNKETKDGGSRKGLILSIVALIINIVFVLFALIIVTVAPLLKYLLLPLLIPVLYPFFEELAGNIMYF